MTASNEVDEKLSNLESQMQKFDAMHPVNSAPNLGATYTNPSQSLYGINDSKGNYGVSKAGGMS